MRAALMAIMETCGRIHGDLAAGQQASDNSLADIQVKQAYANSHQARQPVVRVFKHTTNTATVCVPLTCVEDGATDRRVFAVAV